MSSTTRGDADRYGRHHTVGAASRYMAEVRTDQAEVFRDDGNRVDAFAIPHGSSLRQVFVERGWRPTGDRAAGRGWGAILVEPIRSH